MPNDAESQLKLDRPVVLACLDGVLCQGDHLLPGAKSFLRGLLASETRFLLLSNDSWRSVAEWQAVFSREGLSVNREQFLTSAEATTLCLTATAPPGARIMVIGGVGLRTELESHGLEVVDRKPDIVVVGHDPQVTYASLTSACQAVSRGALLIGSNADRTVIASDGSEIPGPGATLAFIEAATGQQAIVMGMPQPLMYHLALERLDVSTSEVTFIGDSLEARSSARMSLRSTQWSRLPAARRSVPFGEVTQSPITSSVRSRTCCRRQCGRPPPHGCMRFASRSPAL